MKSTVDEIRQRFDADVERFSNLDTGQSAMVDAPLAMALVAQAAAATTPYARHVLDVGCGAGNYSLKLLERLPNLDVTLALKGRPELFDSIIDSGRIPDKKQRGWVHAWHENVLPRLPDNDRGAIGPERPVFAGASRINVSLFPRSRYRVNRASRPRRSRLRARPPAHDGHSPQPHGRLTGEPPRTNSERVRDGDTFEAPIVPAAFRAGLVPIEPGDARSIFR